jgi:hypothetical protein
MLTVLRVDGLRIVIWPNDHTPPALTKALQTVFDHQEMLMQKWREIHG